MRAPPILWAAAGHPDPRRKPSLATGRCHWCATPIDGPCCRVDDVLSDSFTDQDQALVRSSPLLCAGCTWAMTGRPPDTLRLWSVAWTEEPRGWPANHPSAPTLGASIHLQNKAGPAAFRALLREPPPGRWLCSVADSGQIHTLPFAPVNVGAQRFGVRFERSTITTSAAEYRRLDDLVCELMAAGFSKQDITEGPSPSRLVACGTDLYRRASAELRPYKGGPLLDLVLFLARKDKADGPRSEAPRRRDAGAGDDAVGVEREDQADRVVDARAVGAGSRVGEQLHLLGAGVADGEAAPDRHAPHRERRGSGVPRRGGRR